MIEIWRASSPVHSFKFGFDPTEWDVILITYSQEDTIILEKDQDDLTFDGDTAFVMLTQAETKLFDPKLIVKIQVRIAKSNGESYPSRITYVPVEDVLNDTVLPAAEPDPDES